MKKTVSLCMAVMLSLTLGACSGSQQPAQPQEQQPAQSQEQPAAEQGGDAAETPASSEPFELRLRSGATSGSWYPATAAMSQFLPQDIPGLSVTVTPGAGPANVQAIQDDLADFAFGKMPSTLQGMQGIEPFTEPTDKIAYVMYLYDESFHLVVRADAGINTVEDLKGKSLTTQTTGNLAEEMTRDLLGVYDMTYDDLKKISYGSYEDSVQQIKDGLADAFTFATAVPASVLVELASSRDIKVIDIPKDKIEALIQKNGAYMETLIAKDMYKGQTEEVRTFGGAIHMMASTDLSEDLVYSITKSVVENSDKLGEAHAIYSALTPEIMGGMPTPVPFHAGAEKYFKEIGVLK